MNLNINITERMKHYNVSGLSIAEIKKGQICNTAFFGLLEAETNKRVDETTVFNACSISKFLTSILVMKLTEQGTLDLDEDVNKRLTTWKVPENEWTKQNKVTLRNLLSHQSGIIDPQGSFPELNSIRDVPSMIDLLEGRTLYCRESIEVKYEPESDFHYSDAGFCLIQQLLEDVMGEPFEEIMNDLIFQPLRMNNSTFEVTPPEDTRHTLSSGHNKNGGLVDRNYPIYPYPAASGLWTTPSDLALLVIELMNSLKSESKIGLSASHAKAILTSQGCKAWTGLGVFLEESEHDIEISSLGWGLGFQSMMIAYPYLETGIIIMTNTDTGVHQLEGIIGELYSSFKSKK